MESTTEIIQCIRQKTLSALKEHDGKIWKESTGELHLQYNEIPNWILLFKDSDVEECHRVFFEIVRPYLDEVGECDFTVKYTIYDGEDEVFVDFFSDNQEIIEAANTPQSIGLYSSRDKKRPTSVFENLDSER